MSLPNVPQSQFGFLRKVLKIAAYLTITLLLLTAGIIAGAVAYFSYDLPTFEEVITYRPTLRTNVYDRNGHFIHAFYQENREWAPLADIPDDLKKTIVAIEDVRFYEHWGLDARRLFGAILTDIRYLDAREGASTLTMQLARNAFLTQERSLSRKARELLLALKLERIYTKEQILELYLNEIYLGAGCYGVGTVSKRYFGKPVWELNAAQCTFLAGLPKNPEGYSPIHHLDRGKRRQRTVLSVLAKQGILTAPAADSLWLQDLEIAPKPPAIPNGAYFVEEVRKLLLEKYDEEFVYHSGSNIYTTLELSWQKLADSLYTAYMDSLDKRAPDDTTLALEGALVALDPQTGGVLTLVGGRDYLKSQFNRVTQARRQVGSAFKPLVYAAAIKKGYSPADIIADLPDTVQFDNQTWTPDNITHQFSGKTTLRQALNRSLNTVAVQLLQEIGIDYALPIIKDFGISGEVPAYPSLVLGTASVSPLEMTAAFNAFNHAGIYNKPYLIEKIIDGNGALLEQHTSSPKEVLTASEAAVMVSMLQSVVDHGTAHGARARGLTVPAAGKTGTTSDYKDAWFIGFTPLVTSGAWCGYDDNHPMKNGWGGSKIALPLWTNFMQTIHQNMPVTDFVFPEDLQHVTICEGSGKVASPDCMDTVTDVIANFDRHNGSLGACSDHSLRLMTRPRTPVDMERVPIRP